MTFSALTNVTGFIAAVGVLLAVLFFLWFYFKLFVIIKIQSNNGALTSVSMPGLTNLGIYLYVSTLSGRSAQYSPHVFCSFRAIPL